MMKRDYNVYSGYVKIKPEYNAEDVQSLLADFAEEAFVANNMFNDSYEYVWVMGNGNWIRDHVYDGLDAVSGYILEGSVEFSGDNNTFWKEVFNGYSRKWDHVEGHICYTAEDCRKAFPELNKVTVYKEYTDNMTYENEEILVYPNRQKAVDHLMSEVENFLDMPWEEIEEEYGDDGENDIDDDFVKIRVRDDDRAYFVVEEHRIEK